MSVPTRTLAAHASTSVTRMRAGRGTKRSPTRTEATGTLRSRASRMSCVRSGRGPISNVLPTGIRSTHSSAMPGSPLRRTCVAALAAISALHRRRHGDRQNGPTPLPMFGTSARTSQVSMRAPDSSSVS